MCAVKSHLATAPLPGHEWRRGAYRSPTQDLVGTALALRGFRLSVFFGYARAGAYWRIADIDFDEDTEVIMGVDVRGVLHDDTDFVQAMIWFGAGR